MAKRSPSASGTDLPRIAVRSGPYHHLGSLTPARTSNMQAVIQSARSAKIRMRSVSTADESSVSISLATALAPSPTSCSSLCVAPRRRRTETVRVRIIMTRPSPRSSSPSRSARMRGMSRRAMRSIRAASAGDAPSSAKRMRQFKLSTVAAGIMSACSYLQYIQKCEGLSGGNAWTAVKAALTGASHWSGLTPPFTLQVDPIIVLY